MAVSNPLSEKDTLLIVDDDPVNLGIVAGFLEADAGHVILDGVDITRIVPQRRNVGLVFQNYALFPHLNVFENVAYGLRVRKVPEEKIKANL
mgnify:CR=1 FL=1